MSLSYLDRMIQQMIKPNHFNYSEDCICIAPFILEEYLDKYIFEDLREIKNGWNQRIKCTLVRHRFDEEDADQSLNTNSKCIVYLHGYGSIRLQALNILKFMPQDYCLCMFDMSGSGKSEGEFITYGVKESYDIQPVIFCLHKHRKIQEFVLWGRSMGAVAALLYAIRKYSSSPSHSSRGIFNNSNSLKKSLQITLQNPQKGVLVNTVILDSAFYNFRDIAKYMAINRMSVPNFIVNIAINYVQQIFTKIMQDSIGKQYNPFYINFNKQINLSIPILMVYSLKDEVVPPSHSERIIKNIKSKFQQIISDQCNHNEARPAALVSSIFQKIIKYNRQKKDLQQKKLTMSLISKESSYSNFCKRGIFVFTPSKQKQIRTNSVHSLMNSTKSSVLKQQHKLNPSLKLGSNIKRSKIELKTPKQAQNQLSYQPVITETNSLINKKLVGIRLYENSSIRNLRSKRCNLQMMRQQKMKKSRFLQ